MSLQSVGTEGLPRVRAELNYLAPTQEKPRTYTFDPPEGAPRSTVVNEPHEVPITDVRRVQADLTLDEEGFGLVQHKSAVRDFYDDEEVRRVYYAEAEQLSEGADRRRSRSRL